MPVFGCCWGSSSCRKSPPEFGTGVQGCMVSVAFGAPLLYSINLGNLALNQGILNNVCNVFGGGKGEIMQNDAFQRCRKCRIIIGGAQKQPVCYQSLQNIAKLQEYQNDWIRLEGTERLAQAENEPKLILMLIKNRTSYRLE